MSAPSSSVAGRARAKTRRIIRRSSGSVSLMRISPPVTPASAMNEPISMWSGPIVVRRSRRARPAPVTGSTLEPMPRMSAPILTSMRARSWTCGSQAALPMTSRPASARRPAARSRCAMTDGSSMNTSPARRPPARASRLDVAVVRSTSAPRARKASRCGSSRRRPITSPPGGGIVGAAEAREQRPGEQERGADALGRASRSTTASAVMPAAQMATSCSPRHSTVAPSRSSSSSIASTSRMRGTLRDDDLVRGEHGRGEASGGPVLVAGGHDGAGQRNAAVDDELLHAVERPLDPPGAAGARLG